jgi:glycosyltransferase involved in cell wall biosynthesis
MTFASGGMADDATYALQSGSGLIFVSEFTRQVWQEKHALAPTTVIPNGISVQNWETLLNRPVVQVRDALGLDPAEIIILCVGTITPRKGQADVVRAFAQLSQAERRRARLVMVGARPSRYLDELMTILEGLGPEISRQITIVAETSEIGPWYRAADVFVLASYNESYPRVILEAMFFGLAIISSAVFGAKEQVVDGRSGFLFESGDVSRLAECMAKLLTDGALRERTRKQSQRRFWELCTFEEMVLRYASLLFNLTRAKEEPQNGERRMAVAAAIA